MTANFGTSPTKMSFKSPEGDAPRTMFSQPRLDPIDIKLFSPVHAKSKVLFSSKITNRKIPETRNQDLVKLIKPKEQAVILETSNIMINQEYQQ